MKISPKNHNKPVPLTLYRILLILHGVLGLSVVGAAVGHKPWIGMGIMAVGYILDQVIRFIKQDHPELNDIQGNRKSDQEPTPTNPS